LENLPIYIAIVFGLTTLLTLVLFYKATNRSKTAFIVLLFWLSLQTIVALTDFYTITDTIPPRFLLLVMPPILLIVVLFATAKGRSFIDSFDIKALTILHIVRVPVEIVLFWLFIYKVVPELMTFEGRNFDIVSGITAPLIYYFGFVLKRLNKNIIILWNVLCLILLLNIVLNAVFSAPFPFQKFAFDQPNIAILYFPFIWLPTFIVPVVLFAHLVSIRQLTKSKLENK